MAEDDVLPVALELPDKIFPLGSITATRPCVFHGCPTAMAGLPKAFLPPVGMDIQGFRITHFKSGSEKQDEKRLEWIRMHRIHNFASKPGEKTESGECPKDLCTSMQTTRKIMQTARKDIN